MKNPSLTNWRLGGGERFSVDQSFDADSWRVSSALVLAVFRQVGVVSSIIGGWC